MKYKTEITIALPRKKVIDLISDPQNLKHWQQGFKGYTLIGDQEPGSLGAQMEIDITIAGRDLLMIETVTKSNFPEEFHATYEAQGVQNKQRNTFIIVDPQTTLWKNETQFIFKSKIMRTMSYLLPSAFKQQSQKFMSDFKNFAETGTSVSTI